MKKSGPIEGEYAAEGIEAATKVALELETARVSRKKGGKITYKELEELLQVDDSTAQRMFAGDISLTLERFFQLCKILNLDPAKVIAKGKTK